MFVPTLNDPIGHLQSEIGATRQLLLEKRTVWSAADAVRTATVYGAPRLCRLGFYVIAEDAATEFDLRASALGAYGQRGHATAHQRNCVGKGI